MGNGATNPNTASGMLPATSNSSPYIITDVGTLFQYAGGPAWKAFDQLPAIGEASTGSPSDSEYINAGSPGDSGDPDYIPNPMKRGIMVDLGEGNEKTFDKFTFAKCAYTSEYFLPSRIIIQGSNSVGVSSVTDDIMAENWDTLFKSFIELNYIVGPEIGSYTLVDPEPEWSYGSWRTEYFCWINTTAYRYYRVMFGCSEGAIASQAEYNTPWTTIEEWEYSNSAAVSELRFIEEVVIPEGSDVVFVPEIVTGLALGSKCLVSISGITVPTIIINESITANIYNQYLGIDANTVLMLHMDGENASQVFVDSSFYNHEITLDGVATYGYPIILNGLTDSTLPGFGGSGYFPSSYSPSLKLTDSSQFDLGLSNTEFCIDLWTRLYRVSRELDGVECHFGRTGELYNSWDVDTGSMYKLYRTTSGDLSFEFNNGLGEYTSLIWEWENTPLVAPNWFHIAVTYDGTTTRLFVNGAVVDTATGDYYKPTDCTTTFIGMPQKPPGAWGDGLLLNELRVSNGVARWTTDFRVPDAPYIEAFTGRDIVVPVITTMIIPTVRIVIMPPPLTIPEIESVSSFSLKEVQPPGWSTLVPDISSPLEFGAIQNIILHPNVVVSSSLGLRILEVIDKLEIPEIFVDEDVLVADVFLGSKIQVVEIVTRNEIDVSFKNGWEQLNIGAYSIIDVFHSVTPDLKHIFIFYVEFDGAVTYLPKHKISHDFGATWNSIIPPRAAQYDQIDVKILDSIGDVLVWQGRIIDSIYPEQTEIYISHNSGIDWELIGPGSIIGMVSSNDGGKIYLTYVRSLDYGRTWESYQFDAPEWFEDYIPIISYNTDGVIDHPLPQYGRIQNESAIYEPCISGDGMVIIAKCHYYELNPNKIGVYDYIRTLSGWTDYGVAIYTLTLESPQLEDFELPVFIDHGIGFIISKDSGATWSVPFCYFGAETYYTGMYRHISYINSDGSVIIIRGVEFEIIPENDDLPEQFRRHSFYHVYFTNDTGDTWIEVEAPVEINTITPIVPPENYVSVVTGTQWSLTASNNASVLMATITGDIDCYISTNFGGTWTTYSPFGVVTTGHSLILTQSAVSADGSQIMAVSTERHIATTLFNVIQWTILNPRSLIYEGLSRFSINSGGNLVFSSSGSNFYHSTEYGKYFTQDSHFGFGDYHLCMSDDGTHRAFTCPSGHSGEYRVCETLNSGVDWGTVQLSSVEVDLSPFTNSSGEIAFLKCGMSGDGLVFDTGIETIKLNYDGTVKIATDGNYLFVYHNSAWTSPLRTSPLTNSNWAVAINNTGDIMLAGREYGFLYKSTDYGVNWEAYSPCGETELRWFDCDLSDDGTVLLAVTKIYYDYAVWNPETVIPGRAFLSIDSGTTWEEQFFRPKFIDTVHPYNSLYPFLFNNWESCSVNSTGTVLYVSGVGGIWINISKVNEPMFPPPTVFIQSFPAEIIIRLSETLVKILKASSPTFTYRCVLTGSADGLSDVIIPISSFQSRKTVA